MSTHTGRFRPSLVTALVKVAMIGTWRGKTFLDDDLELGDVAGFVPDESAEPLHLPVGASVVDSQPVADDGHSVAA
jgi:hypothetical protein